MDEPIQLYSFNEGRRIIINRVFDMLAEGETIGAVVDELQKELDVIIEGDEHDKQVKADRVKQRDV